MTRTDDEFEAIRHDPDPISRGRRATELITHYQQRATELARLRKVAIEQAHRDHGLNYSEIATLFGVTKGRITQIRSTAPGPERAFFGVGPVSVGIPRRVGFVDGRDRPFFDAVDTTARSAVDTILTRLSLASNYYAIDPADTEIPPHDAIVICGPKSAPVARELLDADPFLDFEYDGRWWITDSKTGQRHDSPYRREPSEKADTGYFARHVVGGRVVTHIAGITSVGSLGIVHWLDNSLPELFGRIQSYSCSGVIRCTFDHALAITGSTLIAGPYSWRT